jgi:hypothetical protein
VTASSGEPEDGAGGRAELCAPAAVASHVRRFQVDEVGHHHMVIVELGPVEGAPRSGFEIEHRAPWLHLVKRFEPLLPCAANRSARAGSYVWPLRSRARAERLTGEKRPPMGSTSWLTLTTRMANGISSPLAPLGKPLPLSPTTTATPHLQSSRLSATVRGSPPYRRSLNNLSRHETRGVSVLVLAPIPEIDSRRRLSTQLECQLLHSFSRLKHPGSVATQGRHEMSEDLIE